MPTRLILPLVNTVGTNVEFPTLFLSDAVTVKPIEDEDYATLHRDAEETYMSIVSPKTLCAYASPPEDNIETFARELGTRVQFAFRTFSSSALLISHAALISKEGDAKATVSLSVELLSSPFPKALREAPFQFNQGTTDKQLHDWFAVIDGAGKNHTPVHITLSRFNSALVRSDPFDRIIDITVSMESLIKSTQELKFKFALFHAFLCAPTADKRQEVFELLGMLYDARSSIVHGDTATKSAQKKIQATIDKYEECVASAQTSISYYLLYLYQHPPDKWPQHLEQLVLGTTKRITD